MGISQGLRLDDTLAKGYGLGRQKVVELHYLKGLKIIGLQKAFKARIEWGAIKDVSPEQTYAFQRVSLSGNELVRFETELGADAVNSESPNTCGLNFSASWTKMSKFSSISFLQDNCFCVAFSQSKILKAEESLYL